MLEFFHKDGTKAMIPICAWYVGGFPESVHKTIRCEIVYVEEHGRESKEEEDEFFGEEEDESMAEESMGEEERSVEDDEENADDNDFITDGEEGKDDVSVVTESTGLPDIDKLYLTL
jgi:hypothetical protein